MAYFSLVLTGTTHAHRKKDGSFGAEPVRCCGPNLRLAGTLHPSPLALSAPCVRMGASFAGTYKRRSFPRLSLLSYRYHARRPDALSSVPHSFHRHIASIVTRLVFARSDPFLHSICQTARTQSR